MTLDKGQKRLMKANKKMLARDNGVAGAGPAPGWRLLRLARASECHHVAGAGGAAAGQDFEPDLPQRVGAAVVDHVDPVRGGVGETSPRIGETRVQPIAAPVG